MSIFFSAFDVLSFDRVLPVISDTVLCCVFSLTVCPLWSPVTIRWLRFCRLLAKKKWRGIGATGVVTILLAALLLCLTAYFENWGQDVSPSSALDSTAPAPSTQDPEYFDNMDIPSVFQAYAVLHNSATASPFEANYVLYEIPGNSTLAHSLLGLVSNEVEGECSTKSV